MKSLPKSIQQAIDSLSRLPGVGPKTAGRLVFYLIKQSSEEVALIGNSIKDLKENLIFCDTCFNIADRNPCPICSDGNRDGSVICVVEESLDTVAVEKTDFVGLYHVLGGAISPIDGINPENLRIKELIERVKNNPSIKELIIATNPSVEGEATAIYIQNMLSQAGVTVNITRIAHGLPMGGDLEYADSLTLTRALEGRRQL